ncbi:MAG: thiamine diphosphokinase [Lachnospiraceae bacterium]|nr:thiamine diphosphokinase [Lachnospiraceae bacterium]MBO7600913.1 thiamine diphosphokinase [Lachnospiraceae bacterium]
MKTALIVSGGDFSSPDLDLKYDILIACDKGYGYAKNMRLTPDVVIGDFDSFTGVIDPDIKVLRYPIEKDDTDTMLAVKYALNEGCDRIVICSALGGRMDHTIANIQSMAYAASHGALCEIMSENEYMRTFTGGKTRVKERDGYSISLFSLSDECKDLSIDGAKYNLKNATLTNIFPLGYGNSREHDYVTISMSSGILLIVESVIS